MQYMTFVELFIKIMATILGYMDWGFPYENNQQWMHKDLNVNGTI